MGSGLQAPQTTSHPNRAAVAAVPLTRGSGGHDSADGANAADAARRTPAGARRRVDDAAALVNGLGDGARRPRSLAQACGTTAQPRLGTARCRAAATARRVDAPLERRPRPPYEVGGRGSGSAPCGRGAATSGCGSSPPVVGGGAWRRRRCEVAERVRGCSRGERAATAPPEWAQFGPSLCVGVGVRVTGWRKMSVGPPYTHVLEPCGSLSHILIASART